MGIVSKRRRQRRAARVRRGVLCAAGALLLGALAVSPQAEEGIRAAAQAVRAFGAQDARELTLEERQVYALQLGVFDDGQRAQSEAQRLQGLGVRCVLWQREKMRIIADVAGTREALNVGAACGQEAYAIGDALESVTLRLSGDARQVEAACALLTAPDETLSRLLAGEDALPSIVQAVRAAAQAAQGKMPSTLHDELAQSLLDWCALMERTMGETDAAGARSYAAVTMYTLCRALRQTLAAGA